MEDQVAAYMEGQEADFMVGLEVDFMGDLEAGYTAVQAAACTEDQAVDYMEGRGVAYTPVQAAEFMAAHHPMTKMHTVDLGGHASLGQQMTTGLGQIAPTDVKALRCFDDKNQ